MGLVDLVIVVDQTSFTRNGHGNAGVLVKNRSMGTRHTPAGRARVIPWTRSNASLLAETRVCGRVKEHGKSVIAFSKKPKLRLGFYTILPVASALKYEYDYIIVGGGTSCLAIANRLSEDPAVQVAVIEAGQSQLGNPTAQSPWTLFNGGISTFTQIFQSQKK
ncbi:hypothetical protein BDV10DRAFT_190355 [Aspergillus recurvatus]